MKKVLFVGDNHVDDKNPVNRSDNYLQATLNKLEECLNIAEELKYDAVILLGDLFHRREVGPLARNGVIKILVKERNFPVYITVGNHDIQSSHPLENCTLGTLIDAGLLIKTDFASDLNIAFAHFHNDLDNEIRNGYLTTNSALIWSCHASISDVPGRQEEHMIVFENIPLHPNNVMVVSGHIHKPMECVRSDKKIFINPGCIGRQSANKDNFERDLKIFALEYDEVSGEIFKQDYILLNSALHHTVVFKMEEIESNKEQKAEVKEFIKSIASINTNSWNFTSLDDKLDALKKYAKEANMEDDVIEIVVNAVKSVNMEE